MPTDPPPPVAPSDHLRFQTPFAHLGPAFGSDWFGARAEQFARMFGTAGFLIGQTVLVIAWITINALQLAHFDKYPFILLNLAFSLQAAYAAPLILLAQTRQADRDKALAEADAQHREALAAEAVRRQEEAQVTGAQLLALLEQNTRLTAATEELTRRIASLTAQIHERVAGPPPPAA